MKKKFNTIITGGVNGIGRAIVEESIARGDTVFVLDCIDKDSEDVEGLLRTESLHYIQTDISDVDSIKNAFKEILSQVETIDLLVNNAGITRDGIALRMHKEDWDAVQNVNLRGTFFCSQQALKKMIRQQKSYIINISSIVGLTGNPGQVNYAASKAGIIAVTKTLAREYGSRNVLINAIAPGFIQTRLTDSLSDSVKEKAKSLIALRRFGTPLDVAKLIMFLSSGDADYITGQVLCIDGGIVL
jgi:3-oxoacyl-[acyl-carrier protein] reductase